MARSRLEEGEKKKTRESKKDWVARHYLNYDSDGKNYSDKRKNVIKLPDNKISYFSEFEAESKKHKKKTMMKDIADRRSKEGKSFLTSN